MARGKSSFPPQYRGRAIQINDHGDQSRYLRSRVIGNGAQSAAHRQNKLPTAEHIRCRYRRARRLSMAEPSPLTIQPDGNKNPSAAEHPKSAQGKGQSQRFRTSQERQRSQAKFVSAKYAAVHVRKRRATRNTAITPEMLDAQVGEVPVVDATPEPSGPDATPWHPVLFVEAPGSQLQSRLASLALLI